MYSILNNVNKLLLARECLYIVLMYYQFLYFILIFLRNSMYYVLVDHHVLVVVLVHLDCLNSRNMFWCLEMKSILRIYVWFLSFHHCRLLRYIEKSWCFCNIDIAIFDFSIYRKYRSYVDFSINSSFLLFSMVNYCFWDRLLSVSWT